MIKALLFYILLSFSLTLSAQNTFQITIDKNDSISPSSPTHSLTETSIGDIYALSTINPNGMYSKIRLTKLNNLGMEIWDSTYAHTSNHEFFPEIMPAHDGGVIVGALSLSYIIDDKDSTQDILVWKINENGVIQWQQVFSAIYFMDMYRTKDGGYLFFGEIREDLTNKLDLILYKTDINGNILWSKYLGEQDRDEDAVSVKEIDGKIYVCSAYSVTGWSDFSGLMYALDSMGNIQWEIDVPFTSEFANVEVNTVFKFNSRFFFRATNGLFEFDLRFGNYWAVPDSLNISTQGVFNKGYNYDVLCGIDQVNVLNKQVGGNYYLQKYDNLIDPFYEKELPQIFGTLVEIVASHDGGILILTAGGDDMQITKTDCLGNVDHWSEVCNSKIPEDNKIVVYPNPSQSEILIEAEFNFDEIIIYSVNGDLIRFENPCSCERMTMDISNLAAGVYVIRISNAEENAISKFVKL